MAVVNFSILGPFEVRLDGDRPVGLGGLRQRALLAILVLHANEVVSTDSLVDLLWGERPPATAVHTIRVFVSQLRAALEAAGERLVTKAPGYRLEAGVDELDAARCESLYGQARSTLIAGEAARAGTLAREALALWRGPPLAEFTYEPFAQAAIARLVELRISCREELIESELALGRHAEVVADLEALVREEPLRERPRGQLMLALYRSGRQADALGAYQDARRILVEDLAVEPSPMLRELEQRILRQDASLEAAGERSMAELRDEPGPDHNVPSDASRRTDVARSDESEPGALLRKMSTVLVARFATGRADPERARTVVEIAREGARRIVAYHGGTFVSGLGGEVIGIFGLPRIREDDALRALRAAADLRAENPAPEAGHSCDTAVRIGVDTGEVVAVAPDDVLGEPVSRAISLMEMAQDGEVLLSDATRQFASSLIGAKPVRRGAAWRLQDVTPATAPSERWGNGPLVGRVGELETLRAALAAVASSGEARLLTLVGDAGIGKSRLTNELLDHVRGEATILSGRCLSYGDGVGFWPLREALAEIAGDDSRDAIRGLLNDADDADLVADVTATALGLSDFGTTGEQVPWAFRRLFEILAGPRPLVLVIDDAHWADVALLDLIDYLVDWLQSPVLLLCVGRSELLDVRPEWGGGHSRVGSLVLGPLSDAETLSLLTHHRGERRLTADERTQILETAEGNPLFAEQLLATNAQDPSWNDGREIPATIQALLAARLDRLGPGQRALIERAAVIGRDFSLAAVTELLPEEARATAGRHLRTLVHRELIQPDRDVQDQLKFHHILVRDVAYRSTPKAVRADLHERFANSLAPHGDAYDEFVGYHLAQAFRYRSEVGAVDDAQRELAVRAAERLATAGRKALSRADPRAAVKLLRTAVELFEASGDSRADALLDLGAALSESGGFDDAEHALRAALDRARATNVETLAARALIEMSYWQSHVDPSTSARTMEEVAEQAMTVFARHGDEAGLVRAWRHIAFVHWIRSDCVAMESALEHALKHAERADDRRDRSRLLSDLARTTVIGPLPAKDGIARCRRILGRAEGDVPATAFTEAMLAVLEAMDGQIDAARERWRRSKRGFADVGLTVTVAVIQMYYAFIERIAGTPENAEEELVSACAVLEQAGERGHLSSAAALAARAFFAQGRHQPYERYRRLSESSSCDDDAVSQVLWQSTHAVALAHRGQTVPAIKMANRAVALADGTDFLMLRGDALSDRAAVFAMAGRVEHAEADIGRAIALYERKGIRLAAASASRARETILEDRASRSEVITKRSSSVRLPR